MGYLAFVLVVGVVVVVVERMLSFMKSLFEKWLWSFQFSELCFLQALLHPLLGGGGDK